MRDPGNDHKLVSFYVPKEARWSGIREEPFVGLGEHLTNAVLAASQREPGRLAGHHRRGGLQRPSRRPADS